MDQNFVSNGNKLIADFLEIGPCQRCTDCGAYQFGLLIYYPHEMKYHTDWNWLMPVIEKITKFEIKYNDTWRETEETFNPYPRTFGMRDDMGLFMFRFNVGSLFKSEKLIEAAYMAVIDFIETHNNEAI